MSRHRHKLARSALSLAHSLMYLRARRPPAAASVLYFVIDLWHMHLYGEAWRSMVAHHVISIAGLVYTATRAAGHPLQAVVPSLMWMAEMSNLPGCVAYMCLKVRGRAAPLTQKCLGVQLAAYVYLRAWCMSCLVLSPAGRAAVASSPVLLLPCWLIWPMGLYWSAKLIADIGV